MYSLVAIEPVTEKQVFCSARVAHITSHRVIPVILRLHVVSLMWDGNCGHVVLINSKREGKGVICIPSGGCVLKRLCMTSRKKPDITLVAVSERHDMPIFTFRRT